ncbi:MAG: hypothetical protein V4519_04970 [Patescibacteria group bacterium]
MTTVYVGCALTFASQAYRDSITALKSLLRERGYEVLEFLDMTKGTCHDVWVQDMKVCVANCKILLAVGDFASTGLGIEIGLAIGRHKTPVLIVAQDELLVTRAIQDPDEENVWFKRYTDLLTDVPRLLDETVRDLKARHILT